MNKKNKNFIFFTIIILISGLAGILSGYLLNKTVNTQSVSNNIYIEDYKKYIKEGNNIKDIEKVLDKLLKQVNSQEEKSVLIDGLITAIYNMSDKLNMQLIAFQNDLAYIEKKYEIKDFNKDNIEKINDDVIKTFLKKIRNSYLLIEKRGNEYYIIVDIESIMKKYENYMNKDLKQILKIRLNEQKRPSYNYSLQEFNFNNIINNLVFLNENKIDKTSPYYQQYIEYKAFYYDALLGKTHKMHLDEKGKVKDNVIKVYEKIANSNYYFSNDVKEYLNILKQNNYIFNDNVEKYLNDLFKKFEINISLSETNK